MTLDFIIRDCMPWLISLVTLRMTNLQGRKTSVAWLWGLFNQLLWLVFITYTRTWGLLLLNAGLWYLYVRNYLLWKREEQGLCVYDHTPTDAVTALMLQRFRNR